MPSAPWLSIIIPTLNEAGQLGPLLDALRAAAPGAEVLVADGGSHDATAAEATAAGARLVPSPRRGRAAQLNYGAAQARGAVFYFLHADSRPPATLLADLRRAVAAGCGSGCYRLAFDDRHWFLRLNAWFTRFDWDWLRFGDQSLFVQRAVFAQAGGFDERLALFEDQEIVGRLRRHAAFRVLPGVVTTSARKYHANGVYRLQLIFGLLCGLYHLGASQARLARVYRRLVRPGAG